MNIMMLSVSLYEGEASGMEPFYQNLLSWGCLLLALPSITYCAWPFYEASWRGLRARSVHIDLPISGAIVIAYLCSVYNTVIGRFEIYYDSIAALVLLLLAGRFLQKRSMERAMDSSELLAALTPRSALKIVNGKIEEVFVNSIRPGDLVSVPHAGTIPCDGVLESERSSLDLSVLTGESTPVVQQKGAELFASTVNTGEALLMRVTKVGADTRIGGVMNLLQASSQKRPRVALFLDAIARFFVWAVLAAAAGTFAYWFGYRRDLVTAIDATVALLVVSCPCVVALATPLTFSLAVAQAAKVGILLKGQEVIERLRQVKIICLDKTRTLTKGQCAVTAHWVAHFVPSNFWNTLANIEQNQRHPVAHALSQFALAVANNSPHIQSAILPPEVHNHPGLGVEALIEGKNWRVGNARWVNLDPSQIDIRPELQVGMNQSAATKVFVRIENKLAAIFELADELRPEAPAIVRELHQRGYKLFILSGDSSAVVSDIARQLDIPQSQAHGELTPEQKAEKVASLARIAPTAMIGDGVNDALALQSAHVGIGVHGSAEVCLQAADVYALKPGLMPLRDSLQGAQNTFGVMYRNLFFSGTYNLFGSLLAIAGLLGPLGAAILMPLSSLTVVSSAIFSRTFSANPKEPRL
jgi:Cu2+-exporting ATPase